MLGIVASEATSFRFCLHQAPRSLSSLSREHPHGWGIAVHDAGQDDWRIHKEAAPAHGDERFVDAAAESRGHVLVAHVRKRTVGPVGIENTHPFRRGRWVFAHNGTLDDQEGLRRDTSPARLAEVMGATDSELFFAYILTHIDAEAPAEEATHEAVERALVRVIDGVSPGLAGSKGGAANFLLSNGEDLYAFRMGRSLFQLERKPGDEVRPSRRSPETGAVIDTPWTPRRRAVLVASEALTDEPWQAMEEGTLLAVRRRPEPRASVVRKR
jgi:predicted glutamine amidotransferase